MFMCSPMQNLKGDHFMLPFEDPAVLRDHVRKQRASEERHGRVDPLLHFGPLQKGIGFVKLTDFGLAVRGDVSTRYHYHDIQSLEYTAPEVMLQAGWSYSADIWNLGLVVRTCPNAHYSGD